jgi:hypothetical protein
MTRSRTRLILLFALLQPSCVLGRSTSNEPLDPARIERLVPGRTTAKEVVELLGAPNEVVQLHKRSAWRYGHTNSKYAGLLLILVNFGSVDARSDTLWVFFDEDQTLYSFGSTLSSHRTQYALPWEDIHEDSDNAAKDEARFEQGR